MKSPHRDPRNGTTFCLALLFVGLATLYRVASAGWLTSLPNFSPVMAMAFCAGLAFPPMLAVSIPLVCLFLSDLLLNAHFGQPLVSPEMAGSYACYLIAIGTGLLLRKRGLPLLFGAVLGNALLFYLVSNTLAWWGNSLYPQTFAGWSQALTVGRPGFPPTWTFFRNSLISDLLFTAIFLGAFYLARKRSAAPSLCRQESSS